MALGLFKRWFGGDSRDPGGQDAAKDAEAPQKGEAESGGTTDGEAASAPAATPAETGERERAYYDITPDGAPTPTGQSLHVGRPRSPSPYGTNRPPTGGSDDVRRSQTMRVEKPVAGKGGGKPAAADPGTEDLRRSQTFRVQDLPARQQVTEKLSKGEKGEKGDAAAEDLRRSQTFRVQDLPPRGSEPAKPKAADPGTEDLRRSQTFRVQGPGDGTEGRPRNAQKEAEDTGSASRHRSQTFRVAPPPGSAAAEAPEAPVARPRITPSSAAPEPVAPVAMVAVPFRALAASLPLPLRGPAFDESRVDGMQLSLPKDMLLQKLREGRVAMNLSELRSAVPEGWLAPTTAEVALDLACIVGALPPDMLSSSAEMVPDAAAAAQLGSFFLPRQAAAAPSAEAPAPVVPPAPAPAPAPPPSVPEPPAKNSDDIGLPCAALLDAVPTAYRGPAWSDRCPVAEIICPLDQLVGQLAQGRVLLPVAELAKQLPPGWLTAAEGVVDVPLALVVMAVPPDALRVKGKEDKETKAAARLGSFFVPRGDMAVGSVPSSAPAPQPEPVPAPAPEPEPEPEPVPAGPAEGEIGIGIFELADSIPAALHGPNWDEGNYPEGVLCLDQDELIAQLRTGRVMVPAEAVARAFPAGWLRSDATGSVELPLAAVVAAVPPELLAITADVVSSVKALEAIPDLFRPGLAAEPVPAVPPAVVAAPAPEPEPEPAPPTVVVAEPAPEPEPQPETRRAVAVAAELPPEPEPEAEAEAEIEAAAIERAWDGVELSLERAPRGVDMNTADVAELTTLPGVGLSRAESIVRWRQERGPFRSIYDLADLPGVGPSLFRKMTGFSLSAQVSRHDRLGALLTIADGRRPLLVRIAEALMEQIGADGCVLTDRQGLSLAKAGSMAQEGDRYAALGSRYFLKTKRHLQQFVGQDADCLIVPGCTPPLLLLCAEEVVTVMALKTSQVSARRLSQARKAMAEVAWLLGCRAVVLKY